MPREPLDEYQQVSFDRRIDAVRAYSVRQRVAFAVVSSAVSVVIGIALTWITCAVSTDPALPWLMGIGMFGIASWALIHGLFLAFRPEGTVERSVRCLVPRNDDMKSNRWLG